MSDELYDQQFVDSLKEAEPWENPWVIGILHFPHNDPLHKSIEKWYSSLPREVKPRFTSRLRSLDDAEFIAAFYELVVHQYCLEEGWTVEYESDLGNGKTPDFVVTTGDGTRFVVEVATIFESEEISKMRQKQIDMDRRISKIQTGLGLTIDYKSLPLIDAFPKGIAKEVETWVYEVESGKAENKIHFDKDGYKFSVSAEEIDYKGKNGSVIAIMNGGMVPNYSDRIKDVIEKKNRKYSSKKTGLPLVVVMAGGSSLNTDLSAVDKALYGDNMITFDIGGTGDSQWTRARNGLFTPVQSQRKVVGKTSGVSAVLYIKHEGEYENGTNNFQMVVMHNLLPHVKLDEALFGTKMPQFMVDDIGATSIGMKWTFDDYADKRVGFNFD